MNRPKLKLISFDLCPYVQRAIVMLKEKHLEPEEVYIDLSAKPDWFSAISPRGKVPVLVADDVPIFERLHGAERGPARPAHDVGPRGAALGADPGPMNRAASGRGRAQRRERSSCLRRAAREVAAVSTSSEVAAGASRWAARDRMVGKR